MEYIVINYLWAIIIIASIASAIFSGNLALLANAAMDGAKDAALLCVNLIGVYALWMGILNIAQKSGLVKKIAKLLGFIIKPLFKDKKSEEATSMITLNLSANVLGMGNAATPYGIKAIEEMQKSSKDKKTATDDMCMFLIINASSIQLLPLSVIALRSASGAQNPADIVLTTLLATTVTTCVGILSAKIMKRFWKSKR
ncbi:MAG: nucleoside recognition domain-containing protein [Eubacteriales bacterium]